MCYKVIKDGILISFFAIDGQKEYILGFSFIFNNIVQG